MTTDFRQNCRLHRQRLGWLRPICEIDYWGAVCFGGHVLNTCCKQQKAIALSAAEAELYAMVAALAEALAIAAYSRDLGLDLAVDIYCDSAAAIGITNRPAIGKV